jgi:hypothetical protein
VQGPLEGDAVTGASDERAVATRSGTAVVLVEHRLV